MCMHTSNNACFDTALNRNIEETKKRGATRGSRSSAGGHIYMGRDHWESSWWLSLWEVQGMPEDDQKKAKVQW